MQSLRERVQWIIDSGRVKNPNRWATEAGVSRTQVQMMLARLEDDPDFSPRSDILGKLAAAANVSKGWLAYGEGVAETSVNHRDEGRRQFLRDLTSLGFEEQGNKFLASFDETAFAKMSDRSAEEWKREYSDAFRAWSKPSKVVGVTKVDTTTDGPPIAKRRKR